MIEYLSYFVVFMTILCVFIYLYLKSKYGFWIIQPVFHVYDIGYILNPPGIINHGLPKKNKYTNFKNIETRVFHELADFQIIKFVQFINKHYLQNKENVFAPKRENVTPYFYGHNTKSFISFYHEDISLVDKNKNVIKDNKIVSVMTSRPMKVIINNNDDDANFYCYYVDYLCVDKYYRKKGIAPQMIQTHHYNQSHLNKNISISLFKREDELTGIVPLCVYYTYGYSVDKWTKPLDLSPQYKLIKITTQNLHLLYSFIHSNQDKFDVFIYSEIANIVELLKTTNIFIYVIVFDKEIKCVYFFRKTCVYIEKNQEVLSCFASITNFEIDNTIFIHGFKIAFWKIAFDHYFGYAAVENISHNNIIIDNLSLKTKPLIISPTAYFFYNFALKTFPSNKIIVIN